MTNKEAVKILLTGMVKSHVTGQIMLYKETESDFLYAIGIAVSALMKQEEENGKHCKCQNTGE